MFQTFCSYFNVVSRFSEVLHDSTRLRGIAAVRIEGSQHAQVAQRLTRVLSALHFTVHNTSVPSFTGDVVHFGDEPLILGIQLNISDSDTQQKALNYFTVNVGYKM